MTKKLTTFHYTVNSNSDVRKLEVKTGVYQDAVAAIPALTGLSSFPIRITIWCKDLLPKYGPYEYIIERDACGHTIVRHHIRMLQYRVNGTLLAAGWDAKLSYEAIVAMLLKGAKMREGLVADIRHTDAYGKTYSLMPGREVCLKDGMEIDCVFVQKKVPA